MSYAPSPNGQSERYCSGARLVRMFGALKFLTSFGIERASYRLRRGGPLGHRRLAPSAFFMRLWRCYTRLKYQDLRLACS